MAAGIVGLVCTVVGVFESYRLYQLISEELQGHCDWMPCANLGTYISFAAFVALTIFGGALLSAALLRQQMPRSWRSIHIKRLEPTAGVEPATFALPRRRSTT